MWWIKVEDSMNFLEFSFAPRLDEVDLGFGVRYVYWVRHKTPTREKELTTHSRLIFI